MSVNKNIYYTFLTQGPTLFFGIFINYFLAKVLQAQGKGVYSLFQTDIELFTLFLGFTISSAIVFYISNNRIAIEKLVGIGISMVLIGIVLLTIVLLTLNFFFTDIILFPKGYDSFFHQAYVVLSFGLSLAISMFSSFFQGKSLFRVINVVTLFNSILNFIVFGVLFYLSVFRSYPIDVNVVLVISLSIFAINLMAWLFFYKNLINVVPQFNFNYLNEIKPLFVFMTTGHLAHIVNFLTYKMDYWIVDHYKGAKELGYYSQAAGFSQMFWAITTPIIIVLTPYLASKKPEESIESFKFYSRINFTVIFSVVLIAVLLAGLIFPIYGAEFAFSVLPFRILSIGIIMSAITKIFAVYIYAQDKIIYNLIATVIAFIVTIILDFILIPRYGIIGASIATSVSYTALTIAVSYFLVFKLRVSPKNLFLITGSDIQVLRAKIPNTFFRK